jgi:uncharacterized protein (TIGR01777 family)
MNITIAGASGFIGRRLLKTLAQSGHSLHVLSRHQGTNLPAGVRLSSWDPVKGLPPEDALRDADAVINLAGEPVAQRWNDEVKRRIRESRVTGTRNLSLGIARLGEKTARRPAVLISASATGYYGTRGDETLAETSAPGAGFLAETCVEWERVALAAEPLGVRVTLIRTGMVLDPRGGALQRLLPPFRWGVGGKLGSGKQWTPWIHLEDMVNLYVFALDNPVHGSLNGTAPNPVTNAEFTRILAAAVHRPAIFPIPELAMRLLYGEMAQLLFDSQRVLPKVVENTGYRFRFPQLPDALADLIR